VFGVYPDTLPTTGGDVLTLYGSFGAAFSDGCVAARCLFAFFFFDSSSIISARASLKCLYAHQQPECVSFLLIFFV
jgi:hypothetical protein